MKTLENIRENITTHRARSAWDKGVQLYALELLDNLPACGGLDDLPAPDNIISASRVLRTRLLNGAGSWDAYSYGGCSLIYNEDIAARLCSPSEFRRTRGGQRNPSRRENWLDMQARALHQASALIWHAYRGAL